MNRQRKILITVIYNDVGIIIDTKAEVLDLSANLQQTCNKLATDCISRQQAIEAFEPNHYIDWYTPTIIETLEALPSVQPEVLACGSGELVEASRRLVEASPNDLISRQQAIDALNKNIDTFDAIDTNYLCGLRTAMSILKEMPSAQSERTCVNCGRTANNGGWYADGRTRCPIEEHYALPKDGYCHLWEKRNFTDDDYPERRTDE